MKCLTSAFVALADPALALWNYPSSNKIQGALDAQITCFEAGGAIVGFNDTIKLGLPLIGEIVPLPPRTQCIPCTWVNLEVKIACC